MATVKKYDVLRPVEYGTFADKDARGAVTKTDARRYEAGESIELPPKVAKGLLAEGAIEDPEEKAKAAAKATKEAEAAAKAKAAIAAAAKDND